MATNTITNTMPTDIIWTPPDCCIACLPSIPVTIMIDDFVYIVATIFYWLVAAVFILAIGPLALGLLIHQITEFTNWIQSFSQSLPSLPRFSSNVETECFDLDICEKQSEKPTATTPLIDTQTQDIETAALISDLNQPDVFHACMVIFSGTVCCVIMLYGIDWIRNALLVDRADLVKMGESCMPPAWWMEPI